MMIGSFRRENISGSKDCRECMYVMSDPVALHNKAIRKPDTYIKPAQTVIAETIIYGRRETRFGEEKTARLGVRLN